MKIPITMTPEILKKLRKDAKLTQAELAVMMGVSRDVLSNIGNSKLTLVNKEFNKYLKVLGTMALIDVPLTAHIGRHTFGAMLAEMETPKEVAQKLLGHADIRSTNVYYHLKDKSMDNAMKAWDNL